MARCSNIVALRDCTRAAAGCWIGCSDSTPHNEARSFEQFGQQLCRMPRIAPSKVCDLQPARHTRSNDDVLRPRLPERGKQSMFADALGHVVMLPLVAERTRHAAATGIE